MTKWEDDPEWDTFDVGVALSIGLIALTTFGLGLAIDRVESTFTDTKRGLHHAAVAPTRPAPDCHRGPRGCRSGHADGCKCFCDHSGEREKIIDGRLNP